MLGETRTGGRADVVNPQCSLAEFGAATTEFGEQGWPLRLKVHYHDRIGHLYILPW